MPPKTAVKKAATRRKPAATLPTKIQMYSQRWEFKVRVFNGDFDGEGSTHHDVDYVTDIERVDAIGPYIEFNASSVTVGNLTEIFIGGAILVCPEPYAKMIAEYDQLKQQMFLNRSAFPRK
jgi:hypothetical protein